MHLVKALHMEHGGGELTFPRMLYGNLLHTMRFL